jgi:hypothetical protein
MLSDEITAATPTESDLNDELERLTDDVDADPAPNGG